MAQSTKHRQQLTKSKRTTERPARKTLAACLGERIRKHILGPQSVDPNLLQPQKQRQRAQARHGGNGQTLALEPSNPQQKGEHTAPPSQGRGEKGQQATSALVAGAMHGEISKAPDGELRQNRKQGTSGGGSEAGAESFCVNHNLSNDEPGSSQGWRLIQ
jgi:hypothetical protein